MPKQKNVTQAELSALIEAASDLQATAADYNNRMERGYADDMTEPVKMARRLIAISRSCASLAHTILVVAEMQDGNRELQRLRRAAADKDKSG